MGSMTKRQLTLKKDKFHIRNEFWDAWLLAVTGGLSWLEMHLLFWRHHARPIQRKKNNHHIDHTNKLAFTCSLVALHAKLAKRKGSLSADAFLEFRCLFPVGDEESKNLRTLFTFAWDDDESLASHIQRMVHCYPGRQDLFAQAVEGLARHMLADGRPGKAQLHWLNQVATGFGIHRLQMRHIMHKAELPIEARPHELFEIPKRASESQIKYAYRQFMRRCHPDANYIASLPETKMASEKLSRAANLAYKRLTG